MSYCANRPRVRGLISWGALLPAGFVLAASVGACGPAGRPESRDGATAAPSASAQAAPSLSAGEVGLDVLLITIDTLRADALGAYGNARAATPNLDRLAQEGLRFEHVRAHNVVTLPSHATILSGLHPFEHGIRDNSGFRLAESHQTLATLLAARGYRTGAFVSAFPLESRFGLDRGFDVYEDSFVNAGTRPAFLELERPGTETVAHARRWLESGDGRPSFAWVHLYEPHYPYAPPAPFDRRFAGDPYLGDVAAADAALAPLLEPILGAGIGSDTLVVVTSDHGEALGEHGEATHGIFAYESTLRVPLIFHHPRRLEPRVVSSPAGLIDVLPTILDLIDVPAPIGLPGRSLVALAAGTDPQSGVVTYFEALSGQLHRGWAPLHGVVYDHLKYIDLPIPELYDLAADPGEERNLAEQKRELTDELVAKLTQLRATDPGAAPNVEEEETRARLRALGYLSGEVAVGPSAEREYTEDDDPKRLIELDVLLREIAGLHATGDLEAARARCRELLRRRPDMRMALMTLAQIERDLGDFDAATTSMQRAFELYPEDASTLALLVSYLTQADRAREAADLSAPHVAQARPDIDVLFMRSLALARSAQPREAIAMIEKAGEIDPENPMVAVYRGTHLLMAGKREEARTAFDAALALNPATLRAHTSLALLDTEDGDIEDAVEHWRRAVALEPREHAKLLAIGGRLWTAGNRTAARLLLELFAESAPPEIFGSEIERVNELLGAAS